MKPISYGGKMVDSGNNSSNNTNNNTNNNTGDNYKGTDLFSVKNAYQSMIIQKTLECHEFLSNYLMMTNPLTKLTLAFILLNPIQTFTLTRTYSVHLFSFGMFMKRSLGAFIYRKPQPQKKTFEICNIVDNSINHLYVAFDWYLKSNSKVKKEEDYVVASMIKPIEASKKSKDYTVLKSIQEKQETEFIYDNYTFCYSKTSFDDFIYAPSGEMKKKNHKLLIWTYYSTKDTFDNLSAHVINLYAKSKVDEVWVQKIYTHDIGMWKDSPLDRNKRKIKSVIMKKNKNVEISELLSHFSQTEDWHLERGIPYKKSFLFYGPPGTGKSSMIKAMSFELQRHIHYLSLSTIKNDTEFGNLMSKINYKETILVIEDIDAQGDVVHKRFKTSEEEKEENKTKHLIEEISSHTTINKDKDGDSNTDPNTKINSDILAKLIKLKEDEKDKNNKNDVNKSKLTLSGILNQIDGVHNNHGMILIMTTNHPEKLDAALTRDGRVDERIFFDFCDHEQIHLMFKNFYNGGSPSLETVKARLDLTKYKIAPCNVENSMRRFYNDQTAALENIIDSIQGKNEFEKFEF